MTLPRHTTTRKHHRPEVRLVFLLLGLGFVAIGVAGIFLPVLPTTPFMLLAAACFARSSERFYRWLLNHRIFGATVREWQQHRSIPRRTKWFAITTMAATLAVSVVFFVPHAELQVGLALFGVVLAIYLYHIPSRD
ncbi:MAG: YbaN family protein [Sulfuricaulis sp.]